MDFNIYIHVQFLPYYFKNLWHKAWKLSANKTLELEFLFHLNALFEFALSLIVSGRHHAGPSITLSLFGLGFNLSLSDRRHWNYDENRWETDAEAKAWSDKNS